MKMPDPAQSAPSAWEAFKKYSGISLTREQCGDTSIETALDFAEAYAALRTAQLERERSAFIERTRIAEADKLAAESALRQKENLLALYRAKRESDGGPGRAWRAKEHLEAEEAIAKAEAVFWIPFSCDCPKHNFPHTHPDGQRYNLGAIDHRFQPKKETHNEPKMLVV